MVKMYQALFSSCVTHAVNLVIVQDLSTESFLQCFRRFVARKGSPKLNISDNATTFKAAAKLLSNHTGDPVLVNFLQSERINWKFTLERTPWWGGKHCLRKAIGKAKLIQDEL